MFDLDPLLLSRIQFAFTVSFHILFPSFTIGLAAWLLVLELMWLKTGERVYTELARQWTKIFAVSFGMGVVSGVVLSYEFGTNWSEFSRRGGNVIGPLMSYEVLTAFFLEAGFLGIMLFGRERVPRGVHLFATAMVALGTADLHLLDPRGQQLHADPGRFPRRRRRRAVCAELVGGDLQSVLPLPPRPYGGRGLSHHGAVRRRHGRLVHLARESRTAWTRHARHGALHPGVARAAPARDRRSARSQ